MFHVGNGLGFRRSGQCDLNRQKRTRTEGLWGLPEQSYGGQKVT